jgi:hypothetical protein
MVLIRTAQGRLNFLDRYRSAYEFDQIEDHNTEETGNVNGAETATKKALEHWYSQLSRPRLYNT